MHPLSDSADFDQLRDAPAALVYKHSTRCPISAMALDEVTEVAARRPDLPVGVVDVLQSRGVSRLVAEALGVAHQSPQAILLVRGEPVWAGSHFDLRADAIVRRVDAALAPAPERLAG
jgi:bacillithiol system protein YtxJ